MDTLEHRVVRLEQMNRRYRWCMIGLAALLLLTVGVGAAKDGDGGELVLRKLVIVDDEGRGRIWLGTFSSGKAGISHRDANGKVRIIAGMFPDGKAAIVVTDAEGKPVGGIH